MRLSNHPSAKSLGTFARYIAAGLQRDTAAAETYRQALREGLETELGSLFDRKITGALTLLHRGVWQIIAGDLGLANQAISTFAQSLPQSTRTGALLCLLANAVAEAVDKRERMANKFMEELSIQFGVDGYYLEFRVPLMLSGSMVSYITCHNFADAALVMTRFAAELSQTAGETDILLSATGINPEGDTVVIEDEVDVFELPTFKDDRTIYTGDITQLPDIDAADSDSSGGVFEALMLEDDEPDGGEIPLAADPAIESSDEHGKTPDLSSEPAISDDGNKLPDIPLAEDFS